MPGSAHRERVVHGDDIRHGIRGRLAAALPDGDVVFTKQRDRVDGVRLAAGRTFRPVSECACVHIHGPEPGNDRTALGALSEMCRSASESGAAAGCSKSSLRCTASGQEVIRLMARKTRRKHRPVYTQPAHTGSPRVVCRRSASIDRIT